jgi:hypothetical protein
VHGQRSAALLQLSPGWCNRPACCADLARLRRAATALVARRQRTRAIADERGVADCMAFLTEVFASTWIQRPRRTRLHSVECVCLTVDRSSQDNAPVEKGGCALSDRGLIHKCARRGCVATNRGRS